MVGIGTLLSRRGEPSRRVRRLMVIAGMAVIPFALWVPNLLIRTVEWHGALEFLAFIAWLLIVTAPLLVLQEFRRNLIRRHDADERERQRRDQAYRLSYWIVLWGLILAPAGVILLYHQLHGLVGGEWYLIYWPLVWYAIFLPYMVFAWREPDAAE
jgi:Ca2+/Na+ antiporter